MFVLKGFILLKSKTVYDHFSNQNIIYTVKMNQILYKTLFSDLKSGLQIC